MGLAAELMRNFYGRVDAMKMASDIATSMEQEQQAWIAKLRAEGVKAAHPDDGWVNRKDNVLQFVYPQFNDGAGCGDLVALGWPQWGNKDQRHRIVRLVEFHGNGLGGGSWRFVSHG
jgi:hypothetical protein